MVWCTTCFAGGSWGLFFAGLLAGLGWVVLPVAFFFFTGVAGGDTTLVRFALEAEVPLEVRFVLPILVVVVVEVFNCATK